MTNSSDGALLRACAQKKYEGCVGLFNDWLMRSGGDAIAEWRRVGDKYELEALDAAGSGEHTSVIVDFLLQVRKRARESERTDRKVLQPRVSVLGACGAQMTTGEGLVLE